MNYTSKKLDKSQTEFTITVPANEYTNDMAHAAKKISDRVGIKGFRKGSVPYDIIKKEVGEMAILQEAISGIIQRTFVTVIKESGLNTVGMPQISLEKSAPDNDLVYKAVIATMPDITLPDLDKIKVVEKEVKIDEKEVIKTLDALRNMYAKEVIKNGNATKSDKLVVDMNMSVDGVPVEGGQALDYHVYLSEDHYIPGFNDELLDGKKGNIREFSLVFPNEHYQKNLAGKKVDFKVTIKEVYERILPELTPDMVKSMGQDSVEGLTTLVRNNLKHEAERKSIQSSELEMIDKIIEKTKFEDIPEVVINAERQKMFYELKQDLEKNNVEIEQYLNDIKKTEQDIYEGFKEQAEKRAKAALALRQVAIDHAITVPDGALEEELEMMRKSYADNADHLEKLKSPDVRESIALFLQNKVVISWLREKIISKK